MITGAGLYHDISDADYHRDPVAVPSLSSSIARILYDETPFHARYWHPRLRPPRPDEMEAPDRAMDVGSAVHKIMLGKGRVVETLPFDDYRKKEAQALRDASRAAGNIPVLQTDMARIEALNAAAVGQLVEMGRGDIFTGADTEVTMVWEEHNGVWCRARLDSLPKNASEIAHLTLAELKTTDGSADADTFAGRYFGQGYDVQAAFYRRGLLAVLPHLSTVEFEHVVLEQREPYAVNILQGSRQSSDEADRIVDTAISVWGECMKTGQWPGYQGGIIETTNWRSMKREEKNMALLKRMAEWQAP